MSFGLVGWEAISAEVPLIVTRNSGLCQLVERELGDGGTALLLGVDIEGAEDSSGEQNFSPADLVKTRKAIWKCAADRERAKRNDRTLLQMLQEKDYTWESAARKSAEDLGLRVSMRKTMKEPSKPLWEIMGRCSPAGPKPELSPTPVPKLFPDQPDKGHDAPNSLPDNLHYPGPSPVLANLDTGKGLRALPTFEIGTCTEGSPFEMECTGEIVRGLDAATRVVEGIGLDTTPSDSKRFDVRVEGMCAVLRNTWFQLWQGDRISIEFAPTPSR